MTVMPVAVMLLFGSSVPLEQVNTRPHQNTSDTLALALHSEPIVFPGTMESAGPDHVMGVGERAISEVQERANAWDVMTSRAKKSKRIIDTP